MNAPDDKSMYFLGGLEGQESQWTQLCTQWHNDQSTMRYRDDQKHPRRPAIDPFHLDQAVDDPPSLILCVTFAFWIHLLSIALRRSCKANVCVPANTERTAVDSSVEV